MPKEVIVPGSSHPCSIPLFVSSRLNGAGHARYTTERKIDELQDAIGRLIERLNKQSLLTDNDIFEIINMGFDNGGCEIRKIKNA